MQWRIFLIWKIFRQGGINILYQEHVLILELFFIRRRKNAKSIKNFFWYCLVSIFSRSLSKFCFCLVVVVCFFFVRIESFSFVFSSYQNDRKSLWKRWQQITFFWWWWLSTKSCLYLCQKSTRRWSKLIELNFVKQWFLFCFQGFINHIASW